MRVLGICGSLQPESHNAWLLDQFAETCAAGEFIRAIPLGMIPHYISNLDTDPGPPAVAALRRQIHTSDAVLIASPEYGHGMPGSLKNALDWLVRSGEMGAKPVAITCAAQGAERGVLGLAMLRQTLAAIDAHIVWDEAIVVSRTSTEDEKREALTTPLARLRLALGLVAQDQSASGSNAIVLERSS